MFELVIQHCWKNSQPDRVSFRKALEMILAFLLFGGITNGVCFANESVNVTDFDNSIRAYGKVETEILKDLIDMKRDIAELRENCSLCFQQRKRQEELSNVAFTARLSKNVHNVGIGTTLVFDEVTTNTGNAYDPQTGVFTCTQDGIYVVTTTIVVGGGGTFGGNIVKNNQILIILDANAGSISLDAYNSASALTTVYLQSGDKIWVKGRWDSPHFLLGEGYSTFSAWIL